MSGLRLGVNISKLTTKCKVISYYASRNCINIIHPPANEPPIPRFKPKENEALDKKRARLLYQSRKRGMLENDLILSTFADKYLGKMDSSLLAQYDLLINTASNDWDIYYWALKTRPVPPEMDMEVLKLLQEHVSNTKAKAALMRMPDLPVFSS